MMVRPEKIGFGPSVGSGEGAGRVVNVIPGQVLETIFMGDQLRCLVTLAPGQVMVVKQQHRTALPVPEPGEQVQLNWAVADTLLI